MKTVRFSPPIPPPRVEIIIGTDLSKSISDHCKGRPIAIFANDAIAKFGKKLQEQIGGELFLVEEGEKAKTREMKEHLEDQLFEKKCGRDTLFIALGGGVLTDLVAFVASTYMRGAPLILIPTTLLGMIDAAIGGKTGVNTSFGKNLIGSFYHPEVIFIDLAYLSTLPQLEWKNGLAEILKYGLIADASLWDFCKTHTNDWQQNLEHIISSSLQTVIHIIEQDPLEQTGYRRILNFGHTVGHALEKISHYEMPHGQAVALGCIAESFLSHHLSHLSSDAFQEIDSLYKKLAFPLNLPYLFDKKAFLDAMQLDKKTKAGKVRSVLIDKIGHALPFEGHYCSPISSSDLNFLAKWLQETYG